MLRLPGFFYPLAVLLLTMLLGLISYRQHLWDLPFRVFPANRIPCFSRSWCLSCRSSHQTLFLRGVKEKMHCIVSFGWWKNFRWAAPSEVYSPFAGSKLLFPGISPKTLILTNSLGSLAPSEFSLRLLFHRFPDEFPHGIYFSIISWTTPKGIQGIEKTPLQGL